MCSSCNSSSWLSELCSNAQLFHPLGSGFRTTASCGYLSVCTIRDRLPYSLFESPSPTLKTQLLYPQLSIPAGSLGAAGIYIESISLNLWLQSPAALPDPVSNYPRLGQPKLPFNSYTRFPLSRKLLRSWTRVRGPLSYSKPDSRGQNRGPRGQKARAPG